MSENFAEMFEQSISQMNMRVGDQVDFRNTIVIMTSNLGVSELDTRSPLGFNTGDESVHRENTRDHLLDVFRGHFRPEFLNRVDELVVFDPFSHEELGDILAKDKESRTREEQDKVVHAMRLVGRTVQDREVLHKLFEDIAPRLKGRPGGYTRIIRTRRRVGDAAEMAIIELVCREEEKAA